MSQSESKTERKTVWSSFRDGYVRWLRFSLHRRYLVFTGYAIVCLVLSFMTLPVLGVEFFPQTDPAQFQLRLRAPTGTRIEKTETIALKALEEIRSEIGPEQVEITTAFIGVQPASYPINTVYLWTSGPHEAVMTVALKPGARKGQEQLRERLRARLKRSLPEIAVSFEAGDIVGQIMTFGSPAPVDVAIQGPSLADDREFAAKVRNALTSLPFFRDLQYGQPQDYPTLQIEIDRVRSGQHNLTMQDVERSLLPATSSSRFTDPNYWRDPASGNAFQIQVEIPQNRMQTVQDLANLPVGRGEAMRPLLGEVADFKRGTAPGLMERYNGQRVVSLTANLHGITLGEAIPQIESAIAKAGPPPRGVKWLFRGQIPALRSAIENLQTGLLVAIAVVFLLLAANFQSVRLALAVILTVPAVLCGSASMLLLTGTTLNIQSFLGVIMAIGIAVSNAILLVSFAEDARRHGFSTLEAAQEGAIGRLRPVLMTACAMIAGMIPMALGLGESGAGTAPLGRAVIGGLLFATAGTTLVVPAMYSILRGDAQYRSPSLNPHDPGSREYVPVS